MYKKFFLAIVSLCLLCVLFPQEGVHIQTFFAKDAAIFTDGLKGTYPIEPLPFAELDGFSFGLRINGFPSVIQFTDTSLLIPGGKIEFFKRNLLFTDITFAQLPHEQAGTLNLRDLKSHGIQKRYFSFSILAFIIFAFFLPKFWMLLKALPAEPHGFAFIVFLSIFVIFLIIEATALNFYHGPDEGRHFFAGSWYYYHILPLSISESHYFRDPAWGQNYLLGPADWGYFFSFKAAQLMEPFIKLPLYITVRYAEIFIVVFFILLTACYVGVLQAMLMLAVYVVIPQASYLELYVTQDSFSLCAVMFALLNARYGKTPLLQRICIAIVLIINSRIHYCICLLPLAYFYLQERGRDKKAYLRDFPWLALVSIFSGYKLWFGTIDQWLHHTTYVEIAFRYANEGVRAKYAHMLSGQINCAIFTSLSWYVSTFWSFFGDFGWMDSPINGIFLMGCVCLLVWLMKGIKIREGMILFILFVINISLSLFFSAHLDYQAQGRYIFPFLATIPVMLQGYEKRLKWILPLGLFFTLNAICNFALYAPKDYGINSIIHGEVLGESPVKENFCFK